MDENNKSVLERLDAIELDIKENSKILKGIERRYYISLFFSSLKWIIIIGLSLGAFYYTKPYLEQLMETYNQISNIGSMFR